ncbi:MAG: hypothetical protein GF308_22140 [Candidatus Heimdallarchaeota archaeon]|nr:hypothetical protein [Candidatus Heimdallarchaeota archaeon]
MLEIVNIGDIMENTAINWLQLVGLFSLAIIMGGIVIAYIVMMIRSSDLEIQDYILYSSITLSLMVLAIVVVGKRIVDLI